MSDPAIKLFGKTIPLPELGSDSCLSSTGVLTEHREKNPVRLLDSCTGEGEKMGDSGLEVEGGDDGGGGGGGGENTEKEIQEEEEEEDGGECPEVQGEDLSRPESDNVVSITEKSETKMNEETGSTTKLKKPDKILPCPRCKSMETKFCYYNNYNVNQPRHFCKKCQRYWTAGGTMRNVPVGAGRRKNKNPVSQYSRHVIITSAEAAKTDPSGTNLLSFSSNSSLCESMASGLNLVDKSMSKIQTGNDGLILNPSEAGTISSAPKVPCFPGPSTWPYVWNGVSWTVLPFYPPPGYWNLPGVSPGTWNNFPWVPQPTTGSGPNSPTLGKHSREENVAETAKSEPERCLWVPKTLRIDDPEEAAKSSIWETLGIKKDEKEETFRAFRSSEKEKSCLYEGKVPGRRLELQVNPAALSRSENFHESS